MTAQDIYDAIYDAADAIVRPNPCRIAVDADGLASCYRTRLEPNHRNFQRGALCCKGCEHLGPDGCTIRALGCRLSHCSGWGSAQHYIDKCGWSRDDARAIVHLTQMALSQGLPLVTREPFTGGPR